ncbi:SGNH/GDSL hydrolase family protein [Stenotrophomonas sp. LGBM10]|uniref:SGNH/GDSL hydrolase family protein n=1 Tax=Stenotrophomonas sp. LGBM10 TaxID=3390038 RepID=UPI00398AEED4
MSSPHPCVAASLLASALLLAATAPAASAQAGWVASWTASPQPVWDPAFLFPTNVPPQLQDQTVRQVARLSMGGARLRIVLSNAYGDRPLYVGRATVAVSAADGAVVPGSVRELRFDGEPDARIAAGAPLRSDAVALPVQALGRVTVSLYLPAPSPITTFHWDGRQTGWIVAGDQTDAAVLDRNGAGSMSTTARPWLAAIEVETADAAPAVAVIGDSITDGATASLDRDTRWPDLLAERLAPRGVAVINAGISGGRLLSDGMGSSALSRLPRDVLDQPGVRSMIVLIGINDIAWPGTAFEPGRPRPALDALRAGYQQLVAQAHRQGVRVVGMTVAPFHGALPGTPLETYYQPDKDALRQQLNDWIRHGGVFDAVIDADAVLRDPAHPGRLLARYDSGDHLHPGDDGNRALADAVDLDLLLPRAVPAPLSSSPRKD